MEKEVHEKIKGYYGVYFFDDDGNCKNHWLNEVQTSYFAERQDAVNYIEEVRSWGAIRFTQTLVYRIK